MRKKLMSIRTNSRFQHGTQSFNMTPVIDIVFQLIIFFAVVCQFIEAENFPVTVPDGCDFAEDNTASQAGDITVTVMKTAEGRVDFAVGSEKIPVSNYDGVAERLAELIDIRLRNLPLGHKVVTLRIDRDVRFAKAQYALAGIARSSATDIRLAVIKDGQPDLR